tara:strand:- start:906 stop:1061 length:156 start_codon:yes stop_codon:yes gene_type:complete
MGFKGAVAERHTSWEKPIAGDSQIIKIVFSVWKIVASQIIPRLWHIRIISK